MRPGSSAFGQRRRLCCLEAPPSSTPALAAVVPSHGSTGSFFVPDVLERHGRRVPSTGFHQVR